MKNKVNNIMNINQWIKRFAVVFIVLATAGIVQAAAEPGTDMHIRFRLYEGFKDNNTTSRVFVTYHAGAGQDQDRLSSEYLSGERKALVKVYGLNGLTLLARDGFTFRKGEPGGQSQEIVLGERAVKVTLTPVLSKEDTFVLGIDEKDGDKKNLLESEILVPQDKTGTIGFEGATAKIYYLAFTRFKDSEAEDGRTMKVYLYKRPPLLRRVNPVYPKEAKKQLLQGTVVLDTEIGTNGHVKAVQVIKSAHSILDKAAVAAVKQWRYKPFEVKGGMDALMFTVNIQFELLKSSPPAGAPSQPRLEKYVAPDYPKTALRAHIQGTVIVEVMTDEQGNVATVKAVSGHPLLQKAFIKTVKKWKYAPYVVDGEAKPVFFTVSTTYSLKNGVSTSGRRRR